MQNEIDQLRAEIREVRYLTEAVLMSIVGKDKMLMYEIEAHVQSSLRRQRLGTPLREVGVRGRAHGRLTSSFHDGLDVQTLEEIIRLPRERVAAVEGLGRKSMQKIEAAMAERGLAWAEVA